MSTAAQHWLTLAPAAAIALYFIVAMIAFTVRTAIWGLSHDKDIEASGRSILIGVYLRNYFSWVIRPLWLVVNASGISPNGVTVLATVCGVGSGVAFAAGHFALGGWLFILSGILDTLDGKLARVHNRVTRAGAAFDSLLDRYADGAVLVGLAVYFRNSWVLIPALAALFGTSMVPYVRAKAESFGVTMKEGLMQRPERVFTLGIATMMSPFVEASLPASGHPTQRLAAIGLVLLAVTSNTTAIGRIGRLLTALRNQARVSAPTGVPVPGQPRTSPSTARPRLVRT